MSKVIQIYFRGSDDAHHDMWYTVCTDMVREDDVFHRVIAMFERVGKRLSHHVLCCPRQYTVSDGLTEKELKEMRDFDPSIYRMFEAPRGEPCVISGCYVILFD
jgi:hypothetical protein